MRKAIDPVTLEVLYHRLRSIAEEMATALLKSSFSSIVKESKDCSAAVFDAQGRTLAQAVGVPGLLGALMTSVPQILESFPASQMQEGDVYLANDPYTGGTHMPDITVVVPVMYRGEVVALSCSMVHHQDIGAMTPGVPTSATSIYQEGISLPPLKLYEAGEPVQVVHDIIRKNVRIPDVVIGDIRAQVAAGNVGRRRVLELCDEYGRDVALAVMNQLLDHSETLTRQVLEKLPDGSYTFTDYMDNDGIELDKRIKIQVTVTIRGSALIVDFEGTCSQVKGPFNCVPGSSLSAVFYAFKAFAGTSIPSNAGCFRPITLKLPEGSLVNPYPPAALGARATTMGRISEIVLGALVKAAPERLPAVSSGLGPVVYMGGTDPLTGREYVTTEMGVGGQGARPTKDGNDVIATDIIDLMNVPVEALEMEFPLTVLRSGLYEGSGGAGEYRGGLGLAKVLEVLRGSLTATYRGERHYVSAWGLLGGLPASNSGGFVLRRTGEKEVIPSKRDFSMNEGDQLHMFSTGGGGYGDPLKRKPERVLADVQDRRISLQAAFEDYGVVIDRESMIVDLVKTDQLREERERQRGPITWTYDRGPGMGRE